MTPVATAPTPATRLLPALALLLLGTVVAAASFVDDGLLYFSAVLLALTVSVLVIAKPIAGLVLMIVSFLFVYSKWIPMVRPFTPNVTFGLLLGVALVFSFFRERDLWFLKSCPLLLLAAIGIAYTVSTTLGKEFLPHLPTGRLVWEEQTDLEKLLTRWTFVLLFVYFVRTPRQLGLILLVLFTMLYVAVPASFMMVMSGAGWGGYRARAGWLIHSAGNPNRLAFLCLFAAAMLWCFLGDRRRPVPHWANVLGLPMLVSLFVGAIATGSRSGFLNTVVVATLLLGGRVRGAKIRRVAAALLVLVCSGVIVAEMLPEEAVYRASAPIVDPGSDVGQRSAEKRIHTAQVGFQIFREHPWLGVGMGNFLIHQQALEPKAIASAAHNSYVLTLTEGGVVVFGLYFALFAWCFRALARLERGYQAGMHPDLDLLWVVRALRVNWILFLSFSLFADIWIHIIFYVMVGLVVVLRRIHGDRERLLFHTLEVIR
jgi:O-antigen ligase